MNEQTMWTILELVLQHDTQWGWYQIDRALSANGILGVNVAHAMDELVRGGLVVATGDPLLVATRYSITEAGRIFLGR